MYYIYSTIRRQMILNIKEMTRRNLASAKAEMFKISTSRPSCKLPSVCEHYFCNYVPFLFFLIFSFIFFFSVCLFKCIPLLFTANLTYIIKSTMIIYRFNQTQTMTAALLRHLNEQGYNSMIITGISSHVRYLLLSLSLLWSKDLY